MRFLFIHICKIFGSRPKKNEREMNSTGAVADNEEKPHAVCIPYPAQGHINAMLNFAKLLHHRGFHITFVHTDLNYNRIAATAGPSSLDGLPGFRFETIPGGMPSYESIAIRDRLSAPFRQLLEKLDESGGPKVTCIVSDTLLSFTIEIAAELGIPDLSFCSLSACGFWGFFHYQELVDRGIVPFKSEDELSSGYLDTLIDWIPGMKNMRLRDFPSFIRTTNPNDVLFNFTKDETQDSLKATAIFVHTFEDLEGPVLDAMSAILPPVYSIGPLSLMCQQVLNESLKAIGSSLWKDDSTCFEWLEERAPGSVIYVNFGSLAMITRQQLLEFAWGLANSGHHFLWVIRPDIVTGDSASLPEDFLSEVSERGLLISWCPQEKVLKHPSIGGFLTHCGWNSMIESISLGVPLICWPCFGDQQTNCKYACNEWGIGLEISNDVKREEVERVIKELLGGEKGIEMRRMALKWKERAFSAIEPEGKSILSLDRVIEEVLLARK